eukprot:gene7319-biopygen14111
MIFAERKLCYIGTHNSDLNNNLERSGVLHLERHLLKRHVLESRALKNRVSESRVLEKRGCVTLFACRCRSAICLGHQGPQSCTGQYLELG